jgi:hypothetical protein
MNSTSSIPSLRSNPVFWIMWALPAAAVAASFGTLAIALRGGDVALPAAYHWEGERLDADFARARVAASSGLELTFEARPASGLCQATLRGATDDPAALHLQFTHGSNADLDRMLRLPRVAAGRYDGECTAIPIGRWRISVEDEARRWNLRGLADGSLERLILKARNPEGPPG